MRRLVQRWLLLALSMVTLAYAGSAEAHLASDSYLHLTVAADGSIAGQWDIALRDLDVTVSLDADSDGSVTWGELRAKRREVEEYAFGRLNLANAAGACRLRTTELMVDYHAGNAYAVLPFTAECPAGGGQLTLTYRLLFDVDPTHRGLLTITAGDAVSTDVFTPEHDTVEIRLAPETLAAEALRFLEFGLDHILLGYDHLLFITVLLVAVSLHRTERGDWVPVDGFWRVIVEATKVLTAFTVAHAITLTLATIGFVTIPSRLIEIAVAITIILAAFDNIWPILPRLRWHVAFMFGLIHGLSFASALAPMQLPPLRLALALGCFNLGVEAGQILLALLLVPIGFVARADRAYSRYVMPAVSGLALLLAGAWLLDRVFLLNLSAISLVPAS